jgi:hypothetical protein
VIQTNSFRTSWGECLLLAEGDRVFKSASCAATLERIEHPVAAIGYASVGFLNHTYASANLGYDPFPDIIRIGYTPRMRPLWPIEREVLEITAAQYAGSGEVIRRQIDTVQVVAFENSGAGFFSSLTVADDAPMLSEKSPLSGAYGSVLGVEQGMGFIVFLTDGRLSMIEGYCNGGGPTTDIDFSRAVYGLMPWSSKPDVEAYVRFPPLAYIGAFDIRGIINPSANVR